MNYGYPKIDLWISSNTFLDIQKFLDIHNYFVIYFGLVSVGEG